MYKNAIENISKFYDLDLEKNSHADELFDVLNQVIEFDSAAIFYLTPNKLTLEFGKNYEIFEDIKLDNKTSETLYNQKLPAIFPNSADFYLCNRLIIKDAIFGLLVIWRKNKDFSPEEKTIFQTCSKIISNLIKDMELSKILKMQITSMEEGLLETNQAYESIKKQNKKIKAAEKLQNEFIANISHDLRTPLNAIISSSEILSKKIFGELSPKQQEYIDDIKLASIKLLTMINEILDISKIESHTIKLNPSTFHLEQMILEVCNIVTPIATNKKINIITNIDKNIQLCADYIKIQQILLNILSNALKYAKSEIKITATDNSQKLIIEITDDGIGIDEKFHKKIFNKFFQIQNTMNKTEASTGLGLAIAKEFVRLHNGKIEIESKLNQYTTFRITLPVAID